MKRGLLTLHVLKLTHITYVYITIYTHNSLYRCLIHKPDNACVPSSLSVSAGIHTYTYTVFTHSMHADQAYNKLTLTHIHTYIHNIYVYTHTTRVLYRMYMMKTVPSNNSTVRGKMKERNSLPSFSSTQMTVGRRGNTISMKGESIREGSERCCTIYI